MKRIGLLSTGSALSVYLFAQTILPDPEVLTRRVADNVLRHSTFNFFNTATAETWKGVDGLTYAESLKIKSPYNTWNYWNGVMNIAMLRLAKKVEEDKYRDFAIRNYDFAFSNFSLFKKNYKGQNKWEYPFGQYIVMEALDDCGAMAAGLADMYLLEKQKRYRDYLEKTGDYILNKQDRLKTGHWYAKNRGK